MNKYLKYFISFAFTFILAWSGSTTHVFAATNTCSLTPIGRGGTGGIRCAIDGKLYYCPSINDCSTSGGDRNNGEPILSFDPTKECTGSTDENPQIYTALGCIPTSTSGFTASLLAFLAGTAGAIALVIMLIGTIQIMTGGDNPEAVKKGKELFTGAITGLLFIIFSVTLLKIVAGDIIQLPGFTQPQDLSEGEKR